MTQPFFLYAPEKTTSVSPWSFIFCGSYIVNRPFR